MVTNLLKWTLCQLFGTTRGQYLFSLVQQLGVTSPLDDRRVLLWACQQFFGTIRGRKVYDYIVALEPAAIDALGK
jgi:hypothetical protein